MNKLWQFVKFKFFAASIALCAMLAVMVAKATKPNRIYFPKIRLKIRGEVFLIKRRHFQNIGEIWGIAQLGERLNGIQEVSGSIPLISTKQTTKPRLCGLNFLRENRRRVCFNRSTPCGFLSALTHLDNRHFYDILNFTFPLIEVETETCGA